MVETNHQTPGGLINTYAGALRSFEDTVVQDTIRQTQGYSMVLQL